MHLNNAYNSIKIFISDVRHVKHSKNISIKSDHLVYIFWCDNWFKPRPMTSAYRNHMARQLICICNYSKMHTKWAFYITLKAGQKCIGTGAKSARNSDVWGSRTGVIFIHPKIFIAICLVVSNSLSDHVGENQTTWVVLGSRFAAKDEKGTA